MKFGRFSLSEAAGTILAHSIATPSGAIKKGRTLGPAEIARLEAAQITSVVAARLEPDDVGEDLAAERIARAVGGGGLRLAAPFTGRANLYATAAGIVVLDRERIRRLNAIDEAITIATVPPYERVEPGQMVATVKVITFAVPDAAVRAAEDIVGNAEGLIQLAPLAPHGAGLILTRMASTKTSVLAKRQQAIEARLKALGSTVAFVETVPHEEEPVRAAIVRMKGAGARPIVLFAASAIVDRGDIIPAALVAAGGSITRLGMPVDPGNLMLLGRFDDTDVVGAPSCAASPKLNGFDWVLERLLAGISLESEDVAEMGIGGLLKEIATRPQPREGGEAALESEEAARRAPRIGVLLLAAGRSTRFGPSNKLLANLDGAPLVRRTAMNMLASQAAGLTVVTGHMADEVAAALDGLDATVVHNCDFAEGLSSSLKAGLKALPPGLDGVVVALGDMPRITAGHIDKLIAAFAPKEGRAIVVPVHDGKRGNPVLFSADLVAEMLALTGDIGAKPLIGQHAEEVAEVDLGSDAIFIDVDTPDALARLKAGD
ncbi:MAG: molybdopterin-binding/glycosyltransferase family 2 protein [Hyphomicrobiaceae bacterium]